MYRSGEARPLYRDGRDDVVFWNGDHFEVHHQDKTGLFAPATDSFATDVAFDSDELRSLASGDMTGKVLYSLTDLNGDSVGDLVALSLTGGSLLRKRSHASPVAHRTASGDDADRPVGAGRRHLTASSSRSRAEIRSSAARQGCLPFHRRRVS